jgi:hypothetical protein
MSIIATDINDDGHPDIVYTDRYGRAAGLHWMENPGPNAPTLRSEWKNHLIGASGRQAMFIDVSDLDGDGRSEIVLPHFVGNDRRISIFSRSAGSGPMGPWQEHVVPYPEDVGTPKAVAIGDIDLDGRRDIVLSTANAQEKRGIVALCATKAGFGEPWRVVDISGREGIKFDLNLLLDVDGDGDLDVINTEENDDVRRIPGLGIIWYENPARGRR